MCRIIIEKTTIPELGRRPRTIRIILPDEYDAHPEKRYPVLYMHDGQNLVDPSDYSGYSWDVATTLDRLQAAGDISGLIVVGIDNGGENRIAEYSSAIDPKATAKVTVHTGGKPVSSEGIAFATWIAKTLKPSIDARYRTLPDRRHTGTCGSSCGANVSLLLLTAHADSFGIAGALSPALWVVSEDIFRRLKEADLTGIRIYHDMGGREAGAGLKSLLLALSSLKLQAVLKKKMPPADHKRVFDPKARHSELFWQDRFPGFVRWAYGNTQSITAEGQA